LARQQLVCYLQGDHIAEATRAFKLEVTRELWLVGQSQARWQAFKNKSLTHLEYFAVAKSTRLQLTLKDANSEI
jgi:hypothetical protein